MFEREQQRSKLLEARIEEMKLKEKTKLEQEEQRKLDEAQKGLQPELDPENPEEFLQIIENDESFAEVLAKFHTVIADVESTYLSRDYLMEPTDFEEICKEEALEALQ